MEQHEFDTAREVLEYMIKSLHCHEPHATNTIDDLEEALGQITCPEDYPEAD